ncbi:GNAT family protein [Paenarthrobacter sp. PH39-S1]|uniref:GNAT family N-acetyltransferase n=1 Tax=Paenarthrobacter sp. PH39-S1 TaxID=3046204 RepID=UPI0024BB93DC|nr:GNAT family protein [Paenarthrobacter sp. PH39-S1]MDJ0357277.1 GNAT family protein [Paenarthrobacter sp. PH39-S1]
MSAGVPELDDGVVRLRAFRTADAGDYAALNRDADNVRWANSDPEMTTAQALAAITGIIPENWASGHTLRFAVAESSGAFAGTTALHNVRDGSAALGIKLAPSARGRGLALYAVRLITGYAFDTLGLDVLHWHAGVGNMASRRLAERAGFTLEGTVRGYGSAGGQPADGWIFTLTAQDHGSGRGRLPEFPAPAAVVPVLTDAFVTLRSLRSSDEEQLVANCRDPEAIRWTTVPLDYGLADALTFIHDVVPRGWASGETHTFAVTDTGMDTLLGTIDLHGFRPGTAELGINMASQARGSGAAEGAARLLIDYAFTGLNLQYLYWRALVPNWASRKLAWKLGFQLEAQLRGFTDDRGTPADAWILTLAAADQRHPRTPWDGAVAP